jgi:hypothetical protein
VVEYMAVGKLTITEILLNRNMELPSRENRVVRGGSAF